MSDKPKPNLVDILLRLCDIIAGPAEEQEALNKLKKELKYGKILARLELCPLQDSTPESDKMWEELLERQRKVMDEILTDPPVGKPYPPFETHITVAEARILGIQLGGPHTLLGYPLVIDYEPRSV